MFLIYIYLFTQIWIHAYHCTAESQEDVYQLIGLLGFCLCSLWKQMHFVSTSPSQLLHSQSSGWFVKSMRLLPVILDASRISFPVTACIFSGFANSICNAVNYGYCDHSYYVVVS